MTITKTHFSRKSAREMGYQFGVDVIGDALHTAHTASGYGVKFRANFDFARPQLFDSRVRALRRGQVIPRQSGAWILGSSRGLGAVRNGRYFDTDWTRGQ